MTETEKRRGFLMMSAVFRPLTEAEREELVALVTPDSEPSDSSSDERCTEVLGHATQPGVTIACELASGHHGAHLAHYNNGSPARWGHSESKDSSTTKEQDHA